MRLEKKVNNADRLAKILLDLWASLQLASYLIPAILGAIFTVLLIIGTIVISFWALGLGLLWLKFTRAELEADPKRYYEH